MTKQIQKKESWWNSKALWAGVASFGALVVGAFGFDGAGLEIAITDIGTGIATAVGGVLTAIGVFKARKRKDEE